jgi:hypothetical protein
MAMNFAPLDCSCQGASSEPKKNLPGFFRFREIRKKPIFTSENHLNAHSSLIKPHMAMNFAPLDCSCQGASSEPKKIYLDFSVLEKFAKNQKIHIFGSHSKKWVQWVELLLYLNSTQPIQ